MKGLVLVSLILAVKLSNLVSGHSWLACADYRAELSNDEQDWDSSNCFGFSRGWYDSNNPDDLSTGSMFERSFTCQHDYSSDFSSGYDDDYPYATWTPGSVYRLVWPAKNHAIGDECGETSSEDEEMKILYDPNVNPTSDLTSIDDTQVIYDWHLESGETFEGKGIQGIPFANCMDYCSDTDASPCWGDIYLDPSKFDQTGWYTFYWYWAFTTESDIYISCFDVYIDLDGDIYTAPGTELSSDTQGDDDDTGDDTGDDDTNTGDDDDTTNTGDDDDDTTTTNDDDDDDDDSEVVWWHAIIPVCVEGAEYDEDTIVDAFNTLFEPWSVTLEIPTYTNHDSKTAFNFTGETYTYEIISIAPTINNGTLCQRIVSAFGGNGVTCSVCNGGMQISQTSFIFDVVDSDDDGDDDDDDDSSNSGSNSGSNSDGDSDGELDDTHVGLIVSLVFAILIIFGLIGVIAKMSQNHQSKSTSSGAMNAIHAPTGHRPPGPPPVPMSTTQTNQHHIVAHN